MARWQKGVSGNPRGRPMGAVSMPGRLRQAIAADLPEVIGVLRKRALEGDVHAAALLLSRALAPLRPEAAAVTIGLDGATLAERIEAVAGAALAGHLTPTVAGELMTMLAQQARILEVAELERRVIALECKDAQ